MRSLVAAALLLLSSCGTRIALDSQAQNTTPSLSPTPLPSALPEVVLVPPVTRPTPTPTPSSAVQPQPTVSPQTETTTPEVDVSTRAETTLNGQLFDISGQPVEGQVQLESLQGTPVRKSSQTQGGTYVFNAVPAGVPLRLTATASGYATTHQTVVLKSNLVGNPDANRLNFGGPLSPLTALLSGPQLIRLSPAQRDTFEAMDSIALGLHFDRPVDRESIEQSLTIMTSEALNIGGVSLPANAVLLAPERMFWEWQKDRTAATVHLPPLPVAAQTLPFYIQFNRPFQAQSGETSLLDATGRVPFRLNETLQTTLQFRVNPDTSPLRLRALDIQGSTLQLQFNKPLAFDLGDPTEQASSEGLSQAAHYALEIDHDGSGTFQTLRMASSVTLEGNHLTLDFGDLSTYAQRSARLVFQNGFVPQDLAGHSLETPISALIQL